MSACGPNKSAKEWSKTWRDWKSNTLKKVAKHKAHMMGTGGGSPKNLPLSTIENTLIDFLTPDAAGLNDIAEGGFENPRQDLRLSNFSPVHKEKMTGRSKGNHYSSALSSIKDANNIDKISLSDSSEDLLTSHSHSTHTQVKRRLFSIKDKKQSKRNNKTASPFNMDMYTDKENIQDEDNEMLINRLLSTKYDRNAIYNKYSPDKISVSSSEDLMSRNDLISQTQTMLSSMDKKQSETPLLDNDMYTNKENIQDKDKMTPLNAKYENIKAKYSQDVKKPKLMTAAIDLLEKKTITSENIKLQILEIKREKLKLKKEELDVHQNMLQVLQDMNTTLSTLRDEIVGQYLDN